MAKRIRYPAPMQPSSSHEITIARANPLIDREVLALAALAWEEAERAMAWQEIRRAASADCTSVVLLAAHRGGHLVGAAVAHVLPGRAAIVWPPQVVPLGQTPLPAELPAALLRRLTENLAGGSTKIVQSLLASGDVAAAQPFAAAGFHRMAELSYLSGEAAIFPEEPPQLPFEMRPADALGQRQLNELIDRTYIGTLDCPQIDGLRDIEDVLSGYRGVGEYRPELWQVAIHEGQPVGCLLVNVHADVRHAELVYVGLVPEVRCRGWGLLLTRQALWLAKHAACDRLVLAVDAANAPATNVYRQAGLTQWDRREIWLCPLGKVANA
jgi:ribosomal protein S18 acetylase RimI-like enzyme